jgi:hypothetical protein
VLGSQRQAVATVADNEQPQPSGFFIDGAVYQVGESGGAVTVAVRRPGTGTQSVVVFTSNGSAADGSDYAGLTGTTLQFSGAQTSQTVTIPILGDRLDEGTEFFNVKLKQPRGTGAALGGQVNSVVIVVDDDAAGQLQFDAPVFTVGENGGFATVAVRRVNGAAGSVTVKYQTTATGSTAANGDYTAISPTTLTFADGETVKTFTVPITNDALVEGAEFLNLTLSTPGGGATLGPGQKAVLVIFDDETN